MLSRLGKMILIAFDSETSRDNTHPLIGNMIGAVPGSNPARGDSRGVGSHPNRMDGVKK